MTLPGAVLRAALLALASSVVPAHAQDLDLSGQPAGQQPGAAPQPIQITAGQGIEWRQTQQVVLATGDAKAVRGAVTVTADQLVAHYRKKAGPPGAATAAATPATPAATGAAATDPQDALNAGSEVYELEAIGHVHIYTATDNAYGDHAVYSLDNAVLVLTGTKLKLTTPHDIVTARDAIEYYSVKRMAVARGNALIVADDGRSIAADTLVGYLAPPAAPTAAQPAAAAGDPMAQAGNLRRVEAFGHVVIHTTTDTATGDRGVYLPPSGQARLGGHVHITRGPNTLAGSDALINTKTGVATLLAGRGGQVAGSIVPNSAPK